MASALNIQLSTTASIVGYELVRHVGPVSAQFVIGTGLFTDVFSSFTDFFGAGSKSYQKKLSKVERQGLDMIRARAAAVGANAVIGLRIDHDEISGAGKSMLMVTLAGTGVVARKTTARETEGTDGRLTPDRLQSEVAVRAFTAKFSDNSNGFGLSNWDFVLEHPRTELAPLVLARMAYALGPNVMTDQRDRDVAQATAFFSSLPMDEAQAVLYGRLGDGDRRGSAAGILLTQARLADLARHLDALESGDAVRASNAIRSATAHAPLYQAQDVGTLKAIAAQLRDGFPVTATRNEKKGILSSATWTCGHCEAENAGSHNRCKECHRDKRGLDGVEADLDALAATLEGRAAALEAALDG